ncbi:MAG: 2-amino-3-ketobutyrate coenzyme A ligase [Chloroflexota bacterium]|nr:MAG: 2-amino-3-ketobutyrate coenzyme A ligase [Chloroflexota bacterium]
MAYLSIQNWLQEQLSEMSNNGLYKDEKIIKSPQQSDIDTTNGTIINFCANNYLGLANHPEIISSVKEGIEDYGFGMASVRFICGTQDIHKKLESEISSFIGTEDTILYSSCFDANTGLFETLIGSEDVILSDALNHASIIDGIRLCKAQRKVYSHSDMKELENLLIDSSNARFRLIVTDGVFSMQGDYARLDEICDLADKYDALVVVDDSHATGFVGANGKGTPEHFGVVDRVDIVTSTLGKAIGGGAGGFTTGHKDIINFLRQKSRPYLFSNTIAPPIVLGALKALELLQRDSTLRDHLWDNTNYFRKEMVSLGFNILPGEHPIVPVMIGDELKNLALAKEINAKGIFVVAFSFPVVPRGEARIRVQMSASHTRSQIDKCLTAFKEAGNYLGII